jgi:putative membrane protein
MNTLTHWVLSTIAVIIAAYLLPGVVVTNLLSALLVAVVLGLLNTFIRPILIVLTLPINIVTLGLFTFIINALIILVASGITPGFHVGNFWWALLFSVVLSILNGILDRLFNNT